MEITTANMEKLSAECDQNIDAGPVRMPRSNASRFQSQTPRVVPKPSAETKLKKESSGDEYNMNHARRGMAIIFNNSIFQEKTHMSERQGSDLDAANLYTTLADLNFQVTIHNNKTTTEMLMNIMEVSTMDHGDADCFICIILSHGEEGMVYGADGIIDVKTLMDPMKGNQAPTLVGKPKLFFIQACRGQEFDDGVECHDADVPDAGMDKGYRIPSEADILVAYSTTPGYYSWRNKRKGSWFIQALCKVLADYGSRRELLWILTKVNRCVAYEFESFSMYGMMDQKKQMPCILSMLTKEVYFRPKDGTKL